MAVANSPAPLSPVPTLAHESLYVGIDVGKQFHVAGFVSATLLARHGRFESCPALKFDQAREGFRQLADRIRAYVPLQQCHVLIEQTGHYHRALVEYLLELGAAVYVCHVQARPLGLLKSDRRDALALANQLFNQLEKGVQAGERSQSVRRAVPATETALLLKGLMRHRYELSHDRIRRKNKLTAIADQLFPEFATVFRDPNRPVALALRERFPTPHAIASATLGELEAVRRRNHPSREQLRRLQDLAERSIGVRDPIRQRALVFEQGQLIRELRLLEEHLGQIDAEARRLVEGAREGRILTSIPGIGTIPAGAMLAAIGHIDNFRSAAALKAYFGWAPAVRQSGTSRYQAVLGPGGTRPMKQMLYLVALKAVRHDGEWKRLHERLVPRKCAYDERTQKYRGRMKVLGRVAGQIATMVFALLKADQELLQRTPRGVPPPDPQLYDAAVHRAHRNGAYRPLKPVPRPGLITQLPGT